MASPAGAGTLQQGQQQTLLQLVRGQHIDERDRQLGQMLAIGAGHADEPGLGLQHHIEGRALGLVREAGNVAVHQGGVQFPQPFPVQPQLDGILLQVVGDQHIGLPEQVVEAFSIGGVL